MRNGSDFTKKTMPNAKVFFDSSALFAGVISSTGAARILLVMSENGDIDLIISDQVITETERSLKRKAPQGLPEYQKVLKDAGIKVIRNPSIDEVKENLHLIIDKDDVPILLAAIKEKVDYLATHNRKHFLDDPKVADRAGFKIGTPGDVLAWIRENL